MKEKSLRIALICAMVAIVLGGLFVSLSVLKFLGGTLVIAGAIFGMILLIEWIGSLDKNHKLY